MDIEAYHQIYRDILFDSEIGGRRVPLQAYIYRGEQEGSSL